MFDTKYKISDYPKLVYLNQHLKNHKLKDINFRFTQLEVYKSFINNPERIYACYLNCVVDKNIQSIKCYQYKFSSINSGICKIILTSNIEQKINLLITVDNITLLYIPSIKLKKGTNEIPYIGLHKPIIYTKQNMLLNVFYEKENSISCTILEFCSPVINVLLSTIYSQLFLRYTDTQSAIITNDKIIPVFDDKEWKIKWAFKIINNFVKKILFKIKINIIFKNHMNFIKYVSIINNERVISTRLFMQKYNKHNFDTMILQPLITQSNILELIEEPYSEINTHNNCTDRFMIITKISLKRFREFPDNPYKQTIENIKIFVDNKNILTINNLNLEIIDDIINVYYIGLCNPVIIPPYKTFEIVVSSTENCHCIGAILTYMHLPSNINIPYNFYVEYNTINTVMVNKNNVIPIKNYDRHSSFISYILSWLYKPGRKIANETLKKYIKN